MSDKGVQVTVVQEKEKSLFQRLRERLSNKPVTTIEESNRFSRLGYLQYPKRQQLDIRLGALAEILESIESELRTIEEKEISGEKLQAYAFKHIKKLFRAFMTVGSPWLRGLDNRELAKKAVAFFELETIVGHLPAFYPDLKLCTETLINLSWQAMDVTAETPVLFETRTIVQPNPYQMTLPTSAGAISETYPTKPKGGPYATKLSSQVGE